MVNEERTRSWQLTQERGLELYEYIQQSLDPTTWEVIVKSENTRASLGDFVEKAKKRIVYNGVDNYNPQIVAQDCLQILEAMNETFATIKARLEDSFKSIVIVNEDMNEHISGLDEDNKEFKMRYHEVEDENRRLKDLIITQKLELEKKAAGIKPLMDIVNIRVKEIIKLYKEFREIVGSDEEMQKFMPIFEKEVDMTIKLIELKQKQLMDSKVQYTEMPMLDDEPQEAAEQPIDDTARFGSEAEEVIDEDLELFKPLKELYDKNPAVYIEAKNYVELPAFSEKNDSYFWSKHYAIAKYMKYKEQGKKIKEGEFRSNKKK